MSHIYGVFTSSLPVLTGGYVRLLANYSLQEYIKASVMVRATTLRMVPATLVSMVKDPVLRQQDLSSVRTIVCAGAILAPEIITEVQKMIGEAFIVQGYGMTEGSITFLRQYSGTRKQGSVGRAISGV